MLSLGEAERVLLSANNITHHQFEGRFVDIGQIADVTNCRVWTLFFNSQSTNTPLILLHGLGSGVGWWCNNYQYLASERPVFALDMIGFGQSSRPNFSNDPIQVERELVTSIEYWRQQVLKNNGKKMILLGCDFGAFVASSYAMKFPEKIKHLVLVDPWGFSEKRPTLPLRVLGNILNPFSIFRSLGRSFGLRILRKIIIGSSTPAAVAAAFRDYLYCCLVSKNPTGEMAFKRLMVGFAWAKYPIISRMKRRKMGVLVSADCFNPNLPMTFVYREESYWIDRQPGFVTKHLRNNVNVTIVPHQKFNIVINDICNLKKN